MIVRHYDSEEELEDAFDDYMDRIQDIESLKSEIAEAEAELQCMRERLEDLMATQ